MTKSEFFKAIKADTFADLEIDCLAEPTSPKVETGYDEKEYEKIEEMFRKEGIASVDFDRGMPVDEFIKRHKEILGRHHANKASGSVWPPLPE